jgi:hypothetical protein
MITGNLTPTECTLSITIPNGTSLSGTIDTVDSVLAGIITPAAWTAGDLSAQGSVDGVSFFRIGANSSTAQLQLIAAANFIVNQITVFSATGFHDILDFAPRYLRFRSGTDAVPVNQGVDRIFTCILHPRHPPVI